MGVKRLIVVRAKRQIRGKFPGGVERYTAAIDPSTQVEPAAAWVYRPYVTHLTHNV